MTVVSYISTRGSRGLTGESFLEDNLDGAWIIGHPENIPQTSQTTMYHQPVIKCDATRGVASMTKDKLRSRIKRDTAIYYSQRSQKMNSALNSNRRTRPALSGKIPVTTPHHSTIQLPALAAFPSYTSTLLSYSHPRSLSSTISPRCRVLHASHTSPRYISAFEIEDDSQRLIRMR